MQIFAALLVNVDIENSPVRRQAFAIFHSLLNLIAADDWQVLFSVLNTAVQVSKKLENYQFAMLPNPTTLARILDRFESARAPWLSVDENKDKIILTLESLLEQLKPKCGALQGEPVAPQIATLTPVVDPSVEHFSPLLVETSDVIAIGQELIFEEDTQRLLHSFATEAQVARQAEAHQLEQQSISYHAPPAPIIVALPSDEATASPMVLRKRNTLLSPRPSGLSRSKKKTPKTPRG